VPAAPASFTIGRAIPLVRLYAAAADVARVCLRPPRSKKRQKNRAKKLKQKAKKAAAASASDDPIAEVEPEPSTQPPASAPAVAAESASSSASSSSADPSAAASGQQQQVVLGYWNTRALAHDLRAMLVWGGVEFEDRRYTVGPPPLYDKSDWYDVKEGLGLGPFPNLPFLLDPSAQGVAITQHQTILRYLARKLGLEGKNEAAVVAADMASEAVREWLDAFCSLTYASYLSYSGSKGKYLAETLPHHARRFEACLLEQQNKQNKQNKQGQKNKKSQKGQQQQEEGGVFLGGVGEAALTYADFFLFEVLEQHRLWNCTALEAFPARTSPHVTSRRVSCLALPCLAVPCLALPCLALPCLALPCLAFLRIYTRYLAM
jgi:glutathione S-transferase